MPDSEDKNPQNSKKCMSKRQEIVLLAITFILSLVAFIAVILFFTLHECQAGYAGVNCGQCATGYHGFNGMCLGKPEVIILKAY